MPAIYIFLMEIYILSIEYDKLLRRKMDCHINLHHK